MDGAAHKDSTFHRCCLRRRRTTIGLPDLHLPNHSHFVTYGGSYYSYLYAKMYAAQIWNLRFKKDPLNEASGRALFEGLLKFGVSRPPKILEGICQGQELDPKYYFREITQQIEECT